MKTDKFARLRGVAVEARAAEPLRLMRRLDADDGELPLVLEPAFEDVDVVAWVSANREALKADVAQHGAVLIRRSGCEDPERFKAFGQALSDGLMDYEGGQAVRTKLESKLYTATEYPSELEIRLHHEMSYSAMWPRTLIFACASEPDSGGETTLADSRRVYEDIPTEIRDAFEHRGVTYVRRHTYNRPWQKAYQTDDRHVVEELCRAARREFEWRGDDLVTRETRPGVRRHPQTGAPVWFNFAHGFHPSRLDAATRDALSTGDEDDADIWPSNALYADGEEIPAETIARINDVLERHTVEVSWSRGDALVADNMLVLHGRRPFSGPRRLLLQMADPVHDGEEAT